MRIGDLHDFRQFQQSQHVADGGSIHAQLASEVFDRTAEVCKVILKRLSFFDNVQVLSLQVFFDCCFADLLVFQFDNFTRDGFHAHLLTGSPASFAGDQLITVVFGAHQQRLQHSMFTNALCQFINR